MEKSNVSQRYTLGAVSLNSRVKREADKKNICTKNQLLQTLMVQNKDPKTRLFTTISGTSTLSSTAPHMDMKKSSGLTTVVSRAAMQDQEQQDSGCFRSWFQHDPDQWAEPQNQIQRSSVSLWKLVSLCVCSLWGYYWPEGQSVSQEMFDVSFTVFVLTQQERNVHSEINQWCMMQKNGSKCLNVWPIKCPMMTSWRLQIPKIFTLI